MPRCSTRVPSSPGTSYSSTPTPTSTGVIGSPVSGTDPRGNWTTQVSTAGQSTLNTL